MLTEDGLPWRPSPVRARPVRPSRRRWRGSDRDGVTTAITTSGACAAASPALAGIARPSPRRGRFRPRRGLSRPPDAAYASPARLPSGARKQRAQLDAPRSLLFTEKGGGAIAVAAKHSPARRRLGSRLTTHDSLDGRRLGRLFVGLNAAGEVEEHELEDLLLWGERGRAAARGDYAEAAARRDVER